MPYIKQIYRKDIGPLIEALLKEMPIQPGNLNYTITAIINKYLDYDSRGFDYQSINTVIGVLECAKLELYRRIAVPYEDKKIEENGDVY